MNAPVENESYEFNLKNVKINSDCETKYKITRYLSYKLRGYKYLLDQYFVNISTEKESDVASYTKKEVIKEQKINTIHLKITDKNLNTLLDQSFQIYSSFDVKEDAPFASLSSKKQVSDAMLSNLCDALSSKIIDFLETKHK